MNKTLSNLSLLRGSKILPSPAGYYLLILDVDHDETLNDFGRKRKFLFEKKTFWNYETALSKNISVQHRKFFRNFFRFENFPDMQSSLILALNLLLLDLKKLNRILWRNRNVINIKFARNFLILLIRTGWFIMIMVTIWLWFNHFPNHNLHRNSK